MRVIQSMVIAFTTYSRIPMPQVSWNDENRRCVLCFFPLIGAVIGAALALWLYICDWLSIGSALRGAFGALIPLLITGGIHMDGFMDVSDAMASWQTRERRLEILKDSHVGAFAVMGCAGYLMLFAAAFSEISVNMALPLAAAFVLSRALSAITVTILPSARAGGMLDGFSKAAQRKIVCACGAAYALLAAGAWLLVQPLLALICAAAAGLVCILYIRMCMKHFGGVTGDLAGWFVEVLEIALLIAIAIGGKLL